MTDEIKITGVYRNPDANQRDWCIRFERGGEDLGWWIYDRDHPADELDAYTRCVTPGSYFYEALHRPRVGWPWEGDSNMRRYLEGTQP